MSAKAWLYNAFLLVAVVLTIVTINLPWMLWTNEDLAPDGPRVAIELYVGHTCTEDPTGRQCISFANPVYPNADTTCYDMMVVGAVFAAIGIAADCALRKRGGSCRTLSFVIFTGIAAVMTICGWIRWPYFLPYDVSLMDYDTAYYLAPVAAGFEVVALILYLFLGRNSGLVNEYEKQVLYPAHPAAQQTPYNSQIPYQAAVAPPQSYQLQNGYSVNPHYQNAQAANPHYQNAHAVSPPYQNTDIASTYVPPQQRNPYVPPQQPKTMV